ncbi:MAG: NAD(+)/NADH kinase [Nitrospinota bacterium]
MKNIGLIVKKGSPKATNGFYLILKYLKNRGFNVLVEQENAKDIDFQEYVSRDTFANESELLIVLGGDGLFLHGTSLLNRNEVPILGINLGGLGFLTEFDLEDALDRINEVIDDDYIYEDRMMLQATLHRQGESIITDQALNDIVIHRGTSRRMMDLTLSINQQFVNVYTADGLIVTTPTGSTAYNLSANGPIAYPALNGLIINPICSHTLSNRPIVIPDNVKIEISIIEKSMEDHSVLTFDGQRQFDITSEDTVLVTKSSKFARVILRKDFDYFHLLRSKLNWGAKLKNGDPK